jgi:hypothetical protein
MNFIMNWWGRLMISEYKIMDGKPEGKKTVNFIVNGWGRGAGIA